MTDESELASFVEALAGVRVLTVGDLMLDRFVYGAVDRISPEAPVPVLRIERESVMLGGVGNVARNLRALGATVCLVAVMGRDQEARDIKGLLRDDLEIESHLIEDDARPTTIKTRYIAGSQQMMRADRERIVPVSASLEDEIVARATADLADAKAMVLSDYGKGVLTVPVLRRLIEAAAERGVPVIADPKGSDYGRYAGATLVTPNRRELSEATGRSVSGDVDIVETASALIDASGVNGVLVTRSQDGMTLVRGGAAPLHLPATAREVYDVSGAGDTVVATLAAALGAGIAVEDACRLANVAAGIVVAKVGTATAAANEMAAVLRQRELDVGESKTHTLEEARSLAETWRRQGLKVGFTNGVFDLLHPGHVSLLRQARAACDRLVVGVNSDASVKRLKGESRPIQNDASRALVLGSLATVDAVVIFPDDTPLAVIEALRPDVLVKGADYTVATVVGADVVQSYGGRVMLASLEDGHSTTATVARISKK
ncbi:D-glycero-beta-D-manno-heptose-7-phosphate kinase [Thalassobaculum sp. OXR-137]|uniref:D-glycero-beta-D-manno-heptose-7-phosphate kinase n=1 Tax=Thalassobaculum sp. OXR-137 TaxID=3100173 RepID=UPI002AC9737A|nr:D-glycero-beta-D-manno-heptose-7-phosphate kinase [Thalassobaculum sp. OXR-137]WPZ35250.1 D-glycero-beta-D-manno-heptose-7-phosphate kinase [Thalassobaculum sp. OXR-137]